MTVSLKTMIEDLDPARRRKIEDRVAELIAEERPLRDLHDLERKPVEPAKE